MKELSFSKNDTLIIKGIALIFLLIHHCFCTVERFENFTVDFFPFSQNSVVLFASFCKICVGMFVFFSAYGLTKSYKYKYKNLNIPSKDLIIFTINRYLNLWCKWIVIFFICLLFSFIYSNSVSHHYTISHVYGKNSIERYIYILIDALGLANLFNTPTFVATWWYMSLAFSIIIILPLLIKLYNKFDILIVGFSIIVPKALGYIDPSIPLIRWLFAIVLGIIFADKSLFERMKQYKYINNRKINFIIKFIINLFLLLCFFRIRQLDMSWKYIYDFNDGIVPMFVIYFCYLYINPIPILKRFLIFIGKHSMNIFLIHTIIRGIYFGAFTYSFNYVWLIILMLLGINLILSIIIEKILQLINYQKFINYMQNKVTGKIEDICLIK